MARSAEQLAQAGGCRHAAPKRLPPTPRSAIFLDFRAAILPFFGLIDELKSTAFRQFKSYIFDGNIGRM
jgi:hypothetical protein